MPWGTQVVLGHTRRTIHLVQDACIDKVAAKYNSVYNGRPSEVPMLVNFLEQSPEDLNEARMKTYQELVGYLAYLTQYT
jgi:hypothetical protein